MDTNTLNSGNKAERLDALRRLVGEGKRVESNGSVNNHIHTFYSFSPYSPSKAVWMAYLSGLNTAGIMDHDSVAGTEEFLAAGEIVGVATTNGVECRANFADTALAGRRINNPDQKTIAYLALHAIPHKNIGTVAEFFKPYQAARNARNRAMTEKINQITGGVNLALDFDRDILPLSKADEGGSVTERHLLYALALKIIEHTGQGGAALDLLGKLGVRVSGAAAEYLKDAENDFYAYDLLGVLKSAMVEQFYIGAADECPRAEEVVAFSKKIGAVAAYAYLGDVGDSVTGD
ncbi:MAG: PHP domain-containing protein, partial [Clostridiales bacterium]|nr:PHP domain-containing protein [Clostridiales bacterium]